MKIRRTGIAATIAAALALSTVPALTAQAYAPTPGTLYELPADATCLKGTGNCVVYPKAAQLPSGRLVAAFENAQVPASGSAVGEEMPIYKSDDNGTSWQSLTSVKAPAFLSDDPQFAKYTSNWGSPYLYSLPQTIGTLQQGTLLMATLVSGEDHYYTERKAADPTWKPTNDGDRENLALALYASTDEGESWSVVNIIAQGGWQGGSAGATGKNIAAANTYKQVDPVWEPYLMVYDDQLVTYYSDENDYIGYDPVTGVAILDPDNATAPDSQGQVLVHRTWNGTSAPWSEPVVDVAGLTQDRGNGKTQIGGGRPGMTNVVPTTDGKWMMTFEYLGGGPDIHYKIADNPLSFFAVGGPTGEVIEQLPLTEGSNILSHGGSPVVIQLSDGRLAYNAAGSGDIWVNDSGSSTGAWTQMLTTIPPGYTRNLTYDQQTGRVVILQGQWGGATASSSIKYAEVDLGDAAGTYYQLINRKTGEVIGTSGRMNDDQFTNYTPSIRLEKPGFATDPDTQLWHLTAHSDGALVLLNKAGGRGMGQWANSTAAGTRAGLWVDDSVKGLWNLVPSTDGYYTLQAASNNARFATGATTGAFITLQDATTDGSQDWRLVPVAPTAATLTDTTHNTSLVDADPVGAGATIAINASASDRSGQPLHANTTAHAYLVAEDGTVTPLDDIVLDADQRGTLTLPSNVAVGTSARIALLFRNTAPAWDSITVQPVPTITAGIPTIAGSASVGSELTTDPGIWDPTDVTFSYQWSANGTTIDGATNQTFTPTTAEVGKEITVTVTASKTGYPTVSATSAKTAFVTDATASSVVHITGTKKSYQVGEQMVLTATQDPNTGQDRWQWFIKPAGSDAFTAVEGASTATLTRTVTAADDGASLIARVYDAQDVLLAESPPVVIQVIDGESLVPVQPGKSPAGLAVTGASLPVAGAVIASLLLFAGALMLGVRRRSSTMR